MRGSTVGLLITCCLVAACDRGEALSAPATKSPGRYAGIGVFDVGRLWGQRADAPPPGDPATARLEDDEHVIVVIDSHTGEVRQCGDHSGFCVTMNPWSRGGGRGALPGKLKKHAADLAAEEQAGSTDVAGNAAAPAG